MLVHRKWIVSSIVMLVLGLAVPQIIGQTNSRYVVFGDDELGKIVPTGFFFAGQSGPTQMRNSAAARLGTGRFVVVGLVDTSGYSAEISGKYEGFLITDSPIRIGNRNLSAGAHGFGFTRQGQMRIFALNATQILSIRAPADRGMERPRPLQMTAVRNGIRLHHGRNYVLISPR